MKLLKTITIGNTKLVIEVPQMILFTLALHPYLIYVHILGLSFSRLNCVTVVIFGPYTQTFPATPPFPAPA